MTDNKEILNALFLAKKLLDKKNSKGYLHASSYLSECIKWVQNADSKE